MEYATNAFGICVKKCCASCAQKVNNEELEIRWCKQRKREVDACEVCKDWLMSDGMKMAGCLSI